MMSSAVSATRKFAVLVACEEVIRMWPVEARIAFREAVFDDVSTFVGEPWSDAEVKVAARLFHAYWRRGLPWPPAWDVAAPAGTTDTDINRIADLASALGLEIASAWTREVER